MSVEPRRGCGFRKIGGLYFVSKGHPVVCDRLPIPLDICPTCGHGIKQTRGFTWIDVEKLVGGLHPNCADAFPCPLCMRPDAIGRAGLLWIGAKYYRTPREFLAESDILGVSRRISAIPRGFRVGETWICLAHPNTVETWAEVETTDGPQGELPLREKRLVYKPGIFRIWKPERIEKIVPESLRGKPELDGHTAQCKNLGPDPGTRSRDRWVCVADCPIVLADKGIAPVYVPDNDPDHCAGTEEEENGAE